MPRGTPMRHVTIHVDSKKALSLITRTRELVMGPSLAFFLGTQALPIVQQDIETEAELNGMGKWPPLTENTKRIREYYGFTQDDPNVRSGEMLEWLTNPASKTMVVTPITATMMTPGMHKGKNLNRRKLNTAQRGRSEPNQFGTGGMTETPPRPILQIREYTAGKIMIALQDYIIRGVATGLGAGGQI